MRTLEKFFKLNFFSILEINRMLLSTGGAFIQETVESQLE